MITKEMIKCPTCQVETKQIKIKMSHGVENDCVVCLDNADKFALLECGHVNVCKDCAIDMIEQVECEEKIKVVTQVEYRDLEKPLSVYNQCPCPSRANINDRELFALERLLFKMKGIIYYDYEKNHEYVIRYEHRDYEHVRGNVYFAFDIIEMCRYQFMDMKERSNIRLEFRYGIDELRSFYSGFGRNFESYADYLNTMYV